MFASTKLHDTFTEHMCRLVKHRPKVYSLGVTLYVEVMLAANTEALPWWDGELGVYSFK